MAGDADGGEVAPARRRSGIRAWMVAAGLILVAIVCNFLFRPPFDGPSWKRAAGGKSQDRLKMVDDLISSRVLDGKARAEVLTMLGPDDGPEGTGWGSGYFAKWDARYWLGPERGFISIDSEWLVLKYDAQGRVVEYRLVTD